MKRVRFKDYDQGQIILFPADMGESIPEHAPVRLISRIVDGLEIGALMETYRMEGCPAYNPRMMLKLLFYAYMNNIYSCRRIEREAAQNIHFMWLSGRQYPSFSTINRFRSERLKKCINALFIEVVKVLVEAGVVSLEEQYIDGTKIESVANKYTFVWRKNVERHKGNLERKIKGVLSQIEEGIAQDNAPSPDDDPRPFSVKELQEAIAKINQRAAQMPTSTKEEKAQKRAELKRAKELGAMAKKHAEYENQLETLGNRNSYSKTDKDATFMRMKEDAMNNGQTKPGYNLQISTNHQFITHFQFFPNPFAPESLYYNKESDYYVCPMGHHMTNIGSSLKPTSSGYPSLITRYRCKNCKTTCPLRGQCTKAQKGARTIEVNHELNRYKAQSRELLLSAEGI